MLTENSDFFLVFLSIVEREHNLSESTRLRCLLNNAWPVEFCNQSGKILFELLKKHSITAKIINI